MLIINLYIIKLFNSTVSLLYVTARHFQRPWGSVYL